jgi:hypothetical protein
MAPGLAPSGARAMGLEVGDGPCYECLVQPFALPRAISLCLSFAPLLAALGLGACEDRMLLADAPPPPLSSMPRAPQQTGADPTASEGSPPANAPPEDVADSGPPTDDSPHMVLITACRIDRRGCLRAQPSPPPATSAYRVVLGGGGGAVRTRGQAMADLYKEIRDRTEAGEHLAAAPHHVGDPPPEDAQDAPRAHSHAGDDPIVEAAFELMAEVDRDGELTIDSLPRRAPSGCKLALGSLDPDAGSSRCLVEGASSSGSGTGTGTENRPGRSGRGH